MNSGTASCNVDTCRAYIEMNDLGVCVAQLDAEIDRGIARSTSRYEDSKSAGERRFTLVTTKVQDVEIVKPRSNSAPSLVLRIALWIRKTLILRSNARVF